MKGIKSIGKVWLGDTFEVFLAERLQESHHAMMMSNNLYFTCDLGVESTIDQVLGFASRMYRAKRMGREPKFGDWPEGLWIGDRKIRVQIVGSGTEPEEHFINLDENILLILRDKSLAKMIHRAAIAAVAVFMEWERDAIRRAFRREKTSYTPDVPQVFEDSKPAARHKSHREPRVRPGQLLPPSERPALAEGDEAIRRIMGDQSSNAA